MTVDNECYLRCAGELQIILRGLPADEKVYVMLHVGEEDVPLLTHIGPGQSFLIEWDGEL
nr:phospho-sugar glycosidase domain-containing protein [Domibacillus indicus]